MLFIYYLFIYIYSFIIIYLFIYCQFGVCNSWPTFFISTTSPCTLFRFCSREMVAWSRHCSTCGPWCAEGEELGHTANFQYGRVLLGSSVDATERARLLAAMDKNSGAWLQALPISSIGLRLDYPSLRIAVGLRLGTAICAPHHCQFCGAEVSSLGLHGLCCRKSEGRHSRHASLNDIYHKAFAFHSWDPFEARIPWPFMLRWPKTRWHDPSTLEFRSSSGLGCNMS